MSIARRHERDDLCADGTVFVNGGTSGPGFANEIRRPFYTGQIRNPTTETWTTVASGAAGIASIILQPSCFLTGACLRPADKPEETAEYYSPP